ncbi:MAG: DM13 domain-containing protein [Gammaproteobacteria bacterium]|nr:DM13 domain-containing protein [Gammaproteobacteria bacterium]
MFRLSALLVSHGLAMVAGVALGIYLLPILIAPDAPSDNEVAMLSGEATYTAIFKRDLPGSDFLHWGEGSLSISRQRVSFMGTLAPGPDYRLYLTRELALTEQEFLAQKDQAAYVGDVKTFDNFILSVPATIDLESYRAVIIWCETFGEFITAATYR